MNTAAEFFRITPADILGAFVAWIVLCLLAVALGVWVMHHDYELPGSDTAPEEAEHPAQRTRVGAIRRHVAPGRVYGTSASPIARALRQPAVELPTLPLPVVDEDATTVIIHRPAPTGREVSR